MTIQLDPEQTETQILHDLVDFAGKDVIEIGYGNGRLTWRYAQEAASVVAIDPKEEQIGEAMAATSDRMKQIVTFCVADLTTFSLAANAYDIAIFSWSI